MNAPAARMASGKLLAAEGVERGDVEVLQQPFARHLLAKGARFVRRDDRLDAAPAGLGQPRGQS